MSSSRNFFRLAVLALVFTAAIAPIALTPAAYAQTGGEGAISGTVADSTGAVIPNAVVVARNVATGVETRRTSTGSGFYSISPIIPGTYTITVTAKGFSGFQQENIQVNAASTRRIES